MILDRHLDRPKLRLLPLKITSVVGRQFTLAKFLVVGHTFFLSKIAVLRRNLDCPHIWFWGVVLHCPKLRLWVLFLHCPKLGLWAVILNHPILWLVVVWNCDVVLDCPKLRLSSVILDCKKLRLYQGQRLDGRALCRQLWVVLHHNSILHHKHHPHWLGITSAITLGVLGIPSVIARRQSTKVNRPLACVLVCGVLHHHSILHPGHHPPWLGITSPITLGVKEEK